MLKTCRESGNPDWKTYSISNYTMTTTGCWTNGEKVSYIVAMLLAERYNVCERKVYYAHQTAAKTTVTRLQCNRDSLPLKVG